MEWKGLGINVNGERLINHRFADDIFILAVKVYKYDLNSYEETYRIPKSVLKLVGIRLTVEESKFRRSCWNVFYWFEVVNIFIAIWLELINMVQTAMEGSLMDLFKMMPCVGYLVLAMVKSYKIVYYRPIFENLVSELRGMWPQREVSEEEHLMISKALRQLRVVSKGYYICNIALAITFSSLPYVEMVKRLAGKDSPLILSFFYWLPFDPFQKGYYETILVLQTWQCFVTVWFMLSGDLLFYVFLSHISTQFDLLAVRISRIFPVRRDHQLVESYPLAARHQCERNELTDDARESMQYREVENILTNHRALIRLSGDVEDMFTFSLLLNFINSSIIICFCGFCCVFVEKWNEIVYKMFLVTATAQIWLLCWYGQRLQDSSFGVSEALYNSGWYTSSKKMQKCILLMIHRSQKQVNVTTYGFSIISLASYSTIIKTSWSYFTLLINMYK